MISEMEIKFVELAMASLLEAYCPVLALQALKNPVKSLPTDSLIRGRGMNSRHSK